MSDELFVNRLIKLRMEKGVSAREMSLAMGQSKNYIAAIENGHNLPSMTVFFYICEYLNVSPKDFFDDEIAAPETFNELISNAKKLNKEQLENISGIVKSMVK